MSESWIVGINPVDGALRNDAARVRELLVENGQRNARVLELVEQAKALKIPVQHRPREELERHAGEARHQGIVARYEAAPAAHESDLADLLARDGERTLVLVLDGVTDPHNLGACLRSAAAAGITAVVVPKDRAVGLTPVVRRAAAGGAERVPLIAVTNLARTLRELKDPGGMESLNVSVATGVALFEALRQRSVKR